MTQTARIYGDSLYELAAEESLSETILEEGNAVRQLLKDNPDYLRLLAEPSVPKQERLGLLDQAFAGSVSGYLLNFLKILSEKGYAKQIPDCIIAFRDLYDDDHGILRVRATTAVPLTSSQSARLQQVMESRTGKTIILTNKVDAGSMGGVRLDWDNLRVDDTVSHRLEMVHKLLDKTEL